jgi:hypothetical protein
MRKIVIAKGLALILFGLYLAIGMGRATTPERDGVQSVATTGQKLAH